jgi:hypothetical protein
VVKEEVILEESTLMKIDRKTAKVKLRLRYKGGYRKIRKLDRVVKIEVKLKDMLMAILEINQNVAMEEEVMTETDILEKESISDMRKYGVG